MINCPECNSPYEVRVEMITCNPLDLEWKKKGKGIKKVTKKTKLFNQRHDEVRLFLSCTNCDFRSGNLNGYAEIMGHEEEIEEILAQVHAMY